MKPNDDWVTWECPECGEGHEDPELLETHCRECGLVVIAVEGQALSQNWHVEMDKR